MGDSNLLFESLFRPKIGEADEIEFLRQLAADHPYFSPAQFYLLQHTNENDPGYAEQAAKTALLFNNHFWLNFQLKEARDNSMLSVAATGVQTGEQIIPAEKDDTLTAPTGESSDNSIPGPVEQAEADQDDVKDRNTGIPAGEEDSFVEDYREAVGAPVPVDTGTVPETIQQDQPVTADIEIKPSESFQPLSEAEENALDEDEAEIDPEEQRELAPMHVKLNFTEPAPTGDTLSFEPLHTTDYFASQGIRLSNEIQSTDKLGKQLRSFTEWLKTMKKVHTEQPSDKINQTDVNIQKLAEKSNTEDDVVTEAMADVLLQQGKGSKAKEVYRKLSLLNPAKTAYFAAKIDQLKEQ